MPAADRRRGAAVPGSARLRALDAHARRRRRRRRALRRLGRLLVLVAVIVILVATLPGIIGGARTYAAPSRSSLAGLGLRQRIVTIAESQVGYGTEPSSSYCNKFSAHWAAGTTGCPSGETAEEWCADFAAWAWQRAGVEFAYGYGPGEINGAAASFYQWGVAHDAWHPATSGYVAAPGDVAIYGLSLGADPSAVHLAIVTADARGEAGPDVVNGDGNRTGFSVVDSETDQVDAETGRGDSALAGYVSP